MLPFYCLSMLCYSSYYFLLQLVSADEKFNLDPVNTSQWYDDYTWIAFKQKDLIFIHVNINSLLLKDRRATIYCYTIKYAAAWIPESNLNELVFTSELRIENYNLNHSFPMLPFSSPWKHQKTVRFADVFRG